MGIPVNPTGVTAFSRGLSDSVPTSLFTNDVCLTTNDVSSALVVITYSDKAG